MTAPFAVRLTRGAEQDLRHIHGYRLTHGGQAAADALLDTLIGRIDALRRFPDRGSVPPELQTIGMREYRQIVSAPYRIIYRTIETTVFVVVIADGRRDMATVLERRLLAR
ncbi:type II toxin-antitoxin system RelE/ParE family toxin [Sphingomonas sp. S6]|jgi:toxin ParE1/3/4|uniref:type II toxin-antitoxin system RelE/ParE family toxin n=1 Tax=Sphingomonas sp. S6 TaxID=3368600 RepID=UPI000FA606D5|nr:type II toxin-antitoxin system RelE/ParE family toxin [uncultured Sphingomonas sp.]RTL17458.1 MAG: type II toxin-antitoxin system RelE/ParE family toxin [Sphingomonadaceae bacterium]